MGMRLFATAAVLIGLGTGLNLSWAEAPESNLKPILTLKNSKLNLLKDFAELNSAQELIGTCGLVEAFSTHDLSKKQEFGEALAQGLQLTKHSNKEVTVTPLHLTSILDQPERAWQHLAARTHGGRKSEYPLARRYTLAAFENLVGLAIQQKTQIRLMLGLTHTIYDLDGINLVILEDLDNQELLVIGEGTCD